MFHAPVHVSIVLFPECDPSIVYGVFDNVDIRSEARHDRLETQFTHVTTDLTHDLNLQIGVFENIHVYPLIAKILGLTITEKIDGSLEVLKPILK